MTAFKIDLKNRETISAKSALTTIVFNKIGVDYWRWFNTLTGPVFNGDTEDVEIKLEELIEEGFTVKQ